MKGCGVQNEIESGYEGESENEKSDVESIGDEKSGDENSDGDVQISDDNVKISDKNDDGLPSWYYDCG